MLACRICKESFSDTIDLVAHLSAQHQVLPSERTVSGAHFARRRSDEEYDGRMQVVTETAPDQERRRRTYRIDGRSD
jgi:hypothetical protein